MAAHLPTLGEVIEGAHYDAARLVAEHGPDDAAAADGAASLRRLAEALVRIQQREW